MDDLEQAAAVRGRRRREESPIKTADVARSRQRASAFAGFAASNPATFEGAASCLAAERNGGVSIRV